MDDQVPEKKKSWKLLYLAASVLLLFVMGGTAWYVYMERQAQRRGAEAREREERERKKKEPGGSFDPNDFDATVRWLASLQVNMNEVEKQKNKLTAQEAKLTMLHTLAAVEGTPVQWQMVVASISEIELRVEPAFELRQGKDTVSGYVFVGDGKDPLFPDRFAIGDKSAITLDRASRLKAKDKVTISGRISRCHAESGGSTDGFVNRWQFLVTISEAKIK